MARRIILWLLIAAAAWLLATHVSDALALTAAIRSGSLGWIGVAVLLQVGYYACYISTYRESFAAVGIERRFLGLAPVVFSSIFVNVVMPTAGTAGPALVVDASARRGESPARAAAAMVLTNLADYAGFGVIMIGGLIYLAGLHRVTGYEYASAAILVVIVLALAGALLSGLVKPSMLARLLDFVEGVAVWVRSAVSRIFPSVQTAGSRTGWGTRTAEEFSDAAHSVAHRPSRLARAWGFAVLGHAVDLMSLAALGLAFGWRSPGSIAAAYSVGVLLWIVSIVPQGIGIVETTMTLVLVSFGAVPVQAAAIALTFRGLSFWLPFAAGGLLLRRVESFRTSRDEMLGRIAVALAGTLVAIAGAANVLAGLTPRSDEAAALHARIPLQVHAGHVTAALTGIALLFTAGGLWRRKRMAWLLTIVFLAVSAVSHLLRGNAYTLAIASAALALWLIGEGGEFRARPDPPSVVRALRVLLAAFLVTLAYGALGFYLLDRHFSVNFGLAAALRQTVVMFTQFTNPGLQPITGFGRYFAASIYIIAAVAFGYALLALLRSVLVRRPASAEEVARATAIVGEWGRSSIARLALLPDKLLWFSEGGSVIAYVLRDAVALVLGDPIGPPSDVPAAVVGFKDFCEHNGWVPAFYQTLPDAVETYRAKGLRVIHIGDEAVVDVSRFSVQGKSHKAERNRINHLEQQGYRTLLLKARQDDKTMRELRAVSDAWLSKAKGTEGRFSLGWFDDDYVKGCDVMVVRGPLGEIVAFTNLIPEYRLNEATIDLMRHLPDAPAGVMDYLFVRLIEWCRDQGYETFNLGLASLAGVGERSNDPMTEKAMHLVYLRGNSLYGFRGLHEYKEKFEPEWQPRYLAYPQVASLPRVLWALISANAGDSLLLGYVRSRLRVVPAALRRA